MTTRNTRPRRSRPTAAPAHVASAKAGSTAKADSAAKAVDTASRPAPPRPPVNTGNRRRRSAVASSQLAKPVQPQTNAAPSPVPSQG